jgi:hypothetical protein
VCFWNRLRIVVERRRRRRKEGGNGIMAVGGGSRREISTPDLLDHWEWVKMRQAGLLVGLSTLFDVQRCRRGWGQEEERKGRRAGTDNEKTSQAQSEWPYHEPPTDPWLVPYYVGERGHRSDW